MKRANAVIVTTVLASFAIARAQPAPPDPGGGSDAGSGSGSATTPTAGSGNGGGSNDALVPADDSRPVDPYGPPKPKKPPRPLPDHPIDMPQLITAPTGYILPAAVLYSRTGLDTGGGVVSDNRVGLGDVAEFGVATTDQIRSRQDDADKSPSRIQPYFTASFRMGLSEGRLFDAQPALSLGFRKSFENTSDNFKTRVAELTLVASKKVGAYSAFHLGGTFWDASLQSTDGAVDTSLHGHSISNQIRAFGGINVRPLDRSEIMIDLGWAPEFCYAASCTDHIKLKPELAWGVRYRVADWMTLESGVRVPDIRGANLLDAQIFGMVTFTSWGLRHTVDDLK